MSHKGRNFFFTLNNPEEDDYFRVTELAHLSNFKYLVFQLEEGENGTPHFQGMIQFLQPRRTQSLIDVVGDHCHFEFTRNVAHARKYCMKRAGQLEPPVEIGEWTGQGKRSDIPNIIQMAKDQLSYGEILEVAPGSGLRYQRQVQNVCALYCSPRDFKTRCVIYVGPPGCGKTRKIYEKHDPRTVYKVMIAQNQNLFMDGYDPNFHKVVLFDDFYGGIRFSELLQLMDRYPHLCHIKGASVQFKPEIIYFTSNVPPAKWYPNISKKPDQWGAFVRRVDKIKTWPNNPFNLNQ